MTGDSQTGGASGGPQTWSDPDELARLSLRDQEGVTVAQLSGEVDISNAGAIAGRLTELPNLAHGLIVDLGGVEYLDSTAIALLHELAARLRRRSQRLIVVCPPDCAPRRVLELTALDTTIPVLDELAPAIATLRATD
ncbi:MAG TPA: STAS domain-containing protein [Solirubrobacteraceae bacterium]|nr:STAS domain-containing protein [Solirubrobacteraceae bacterium]